MGINGAVNATVQVNISKIEGEKSGLNTSQCVDREEITITTSAPLSGFTEVAAQSISGDNVAVIETVADKDNSRFTFICAPGYRSDVALLRLVSELEETDARRMNFIGTSEFAVTSIVNEENVVTVLGQNLDQPFTLVTESNQRIDVDNSGLGSERAAFLLSNDFMKGRVVIKSDEYTSMPQYIDYEPMSDVDVYLDTPSGVGRDLVQITTDTNMAKQIPLNPQNPTQLAIPSGSHGMISAFYEHGDQVSIVGYLPYVPRMTNYKFTSSTLALGMFWPHMNISIKNKIGMTQMEEILALPEVTLLGQRLFDELSSSRDYLMNQESPIYNEDVFIEALKAVGKYTRRL
ncbi:hypothetical protein OH460_07910 [Vibrio sp. Makdt]|uniref:hypothetical protein n=1 Tax=Vibrio sp. Makdt TaxID=2998828 RepID=UPI0022CD41AE|nr:hypothetical protein [Vibrio sp. Makdt]MDA0152222.1 hypothetical protein [Vibrio sp. Makdt]